MRPYLSLTNCNTQGVEAIYVTLPLVCNTPDENTLSFDEKFGVEHCVGKNFGYRGFPKVHHISLHLFRQGGLKAYTDKDICNWFVNVEIT